MAMDKIMGKEMNTRRAILEALFDETAKSLLAKVKSGEATASDLNVARQLLKDNQIEADPQSNDSLRELFDSLPNFDSQKSLNAL